MLLLIVKFAAIFFEKRIDKSTHRTDQIPIPSPSASTVVQYMYSSLDLREQMYLLVTYTVPGTVYLV